MSTGRTFPPVWSQSVAWIKPPEAPHSQEHRSLQSECINLCNWRETCSLQMLLKWQNYTLKKKDSQSLQLTLSKSKSQTAVERLFPSLKIKKERKRLLLQAVGCFLAIRMSENLGLFSDLYLLTEAQKFHCQVRRGVFWLFSFLLLEEKNFCLIHYMDCVLANPQVSEKSSVSRC